jgi:nucleotide-binding universal stress UspA family protein
MSFERILVATDFSEASDAALTVAVDLARRLGAELILVHACEELGVVPGSDLAEEARHKAQQEIDARLARLHGKDLRARGVVRGGLVVDEIVEAAADEHASLLVLGTETHSRLAELFGSVVDSVLDRAPCPVLAVRPPTPD